MFVTGENKTSNSYVRACLPPRRPFCTISLLRSLDKTNSTLDILVGLCAGRGSKARIERMQENRIIKALPRSPSDEFEAAKKSILERIYSLTQKYKTLQKSTEDSIKVREQIDRLLDKLVDNPLQVSISPGPAVKWADEVGGSITGIRKTLNLRSPWKESNFGITFRYRQKEEDVDPPKRPTLPGIGSLYGDQWHKFERQVSFSHIYDPTPYDPDPRPAMHIPASSGDSIQSNGSSDSEGLQMKSKDVSTGSLSQIRVNAELHAGWRRARSDATHFTGANDDLTQGQARSHRTSSEVHTIPSNFDQFYHSSCFPESALPYKKPKLDSEKSCAQYKTLDDYLAKPHEYEAVFAFHEVASELNIIPDVDIPPSPEDTSIPAWQRHRDRVFNQDLRKRVKDHRMAASPRSELRGWNANRMLKEQAHSVQEQHLKVIVEDYETEEIIRQEQDAEHAEQLKISEEKTTSQPHRKEAFNPDTSKSFIARSVLAFQEGALGIEGESKAYAAAVAAANTTRSPDPNPTIGINRVTGTKVFFLVRREKKRRGLMYKNVEVLAAEERARMRQAEEATWEYADQEGGKQSDNDDSGKCDESLPAVFGTAKETAVILRDTAVTMKDTIETIKDTVGTIKDKAERLKIESSETGTKLTSAIDALKIALQVADQSVQSTAHQSTSTAPAPRGIRPARTASPSSATQARGIPPVAEATSIPMPNSLAPSCAVESDSDDSDESWDPEWMVERRPIQYSPGGTRMYLD